MNSFWSIKEIKDAIDRKEVTPEEVVTFFKKRIARFNPKLNAVLEVFDDAQPVSDAAQKKLGGIPILFKDNILQKDRIASAGSKILSNYRSCYDATIVARLKEYGAVPVGRGNMDEFAMGASGEFSAYGVTKNPYNLDHVPGGSSAGPAAAVAAGLVPAAIGTETGGSVRQPACFSGLVGLYPTYGLLPRYGLVAFGSSLDQAGPLTRTVYDNALLLSVMAGKDTHDATSCDNNGQDYTVGLDGNIPKGLRIGVIKDALESDGIDPDIAKAFNESLEVLKKRGATITVIDLPHLKYGIAVYFIITRAEAASNLYRYDGSLYGARDTEAKELFDMYLKTRTNNFGAEVKRRILVGNYVLSKGHFDAYYNKAQMVRSIIRTEFEESFKQVDVLMSPTIPTPAFKIGQMTGDPLAMYLADYFTVPNCVIGTPALSVPCGLTSKGLPMGVQFLGPRLSEHVLYKVAYAYEQASGVQLIPSNFD
jgi:aspartyl-tRNA(Asn)/glutamyl-tRNA(Gln) amidotransferase subunit A